MSTKHYYIRRAHRWLGVLMAIQFLAWTVGGLYFAWSDMDEVHGSYEKAAPPLLPIDTAYQLPKWTPNGLLPDSMTDLRLIDILGEPHWQLSALNGEGVRQTRLALARTGQWRPPLSEAEAIAVAQRNYVGPGKPQSVEYLTQTNGHHEYRENPLPAYAVAFDDPRATVVYVAAELGTVQKFRNRPWRRFDFLWMLHTMDYQSRDEIGNLLLRLFSIFALITVCSGLALFVVSRKKVRR